VQFFCIVSTYASHQDFAKLKTYWDRSMGHAQVYLSFVAILLMRRIAQLREGVRIAERSRQPDRPLRAEVVSCLRPLHRDVPRDGCAIVAAVGGAL
jgi:hypothetical protein